MTRRSPIIRTGGQWSPQDARAYFIAADTVTLNNASPVVDNILVAINEIANEDDIRLVEQWVAAGKRVLVDSGVFWLVNRHADRHGISMNEALSIPPERVDGFADLMERYLAVIGRIGERCWGYIEVDQGGRENKKRIRAQLERRGLRPIPVYHPLNDGPDYFDELASRYARICHANVVMAEPAQRLRLLATTWAKRQKYPHLWVHFLGMSPSEAYHAYPPDSCDSSGWLRLFSFDTTMACNAALRSFGSLEGHWTYNMGVDTKERPKANALAGLDAFMTNRTWRQFAADVEAALGPSTTKQVISQETAP